MKLKKLAGAAALFAIGTAFFILAANILRHKPAVNYEENYSGITMLDGLYLENTDSLDIITLGSSHMYFSFNPALLWDQHGVTSYNLASSLQPIWISYYYLEEALKTQSPQLLIIDTYMFCYGVNDDETSSNNRMALSCMKMSKTKLEAIRTSVPEEEQFSYIFDFLYYHSRWNELNERDFTYLFTDNTNVLKGYYLTFDSHSLAPRDISGVSGRAEIDSQNLEYFDRILELAEAKDIPVLMITAPYQVPDEEQYVYNTIRDICVQKNIPYIDYNLRYDEMGLDFAVDLRDRNHLNYLGAEKFTAALGNDLAAAYKLEDRRQDPAYDYWNTTSEVYRQAVDNHE